MTEIKINNATISDDEIDDMVISDELYKKETLKLLIEIRNCLSKSHRKLVEINNDILYIADEG